MKYLMWLLRAAIFFALFAFALNNQSPVQVRLFFGAYWQAPLVLVLLIALVAGVALGVLVMLPVWMQARRTRAAMTANTNTPAPEPLPPHGP